MHRFEVNVAWVLALSIAAACSGSDEAAGSGEDGADATIPHPATGGSGGAAPAPNQGGESPADDDGGATSSSSGGNGPPPTCSIMSSNVSCKSCLEENCCMVVHACLDEDLLGCIACLDCYLAGQGPECCDESVGKNGWLAECIAFNCQDAC